MVRTALGIDLVSLVMVRKLHSRSPGWARRDPEQRDGVTLPANVRIELVRGRLQRLQLSFHRFAPGAPPRAYALPRLSDPLRPDGAGAPVRRGRPLGAR